MEKKPDYIIQIGDLYDFYSASRFAKNPNAITPDQEVLWGREAAEQVWASIKNRAPKAECYQLKGNHCIRPNKKLMELAPELFSYFVPKPLWDFPGVNTIHDAREELVILDRVFHHGWKTQLGSHARFYRKKTTVGHSHRGNVLLLPEFGNEDPIWELNCGYLADPEHESGALKYSPQKWNAWTKGFGLEDQYGPRFISL